MSHIENIEIDLLLEGIYQAYGYDFRNYLRPSLTRRIYHRMQKEQLRSITSMLEKILYEPEFMDRLMQDLSIGVTEMFRDPLFFKALREQIIPKLRELPEIRIWHAGCSTGEEAYSMAIMLQEEGLLHKAQIYATDMNEKAISDAKDGSISLRKMQAFTTNYLQAGGTDEFSSYYQTDKNNAIIQPDILKHIVFAQHNLATDSTFNEFHIVLCRNVLIYFNTQLQQRVHQLLYSSLAPNGYLALGHMEGMNVWMKSKYEEAIWCQRIFKKLNIDQNGY